MGRNGSRGWGTVNEGTGRPVKEQLQVKLNVLVQAQVSADAPSRFLTQSPAPHLHPDLHMDLHLDPPYFPGPRSKIVSLSGRRVKMALAFLAFSSASAISMSSAVVILKFRPLPTTT